MHTILGTLSFIKISLKLKIDDIIFNRTLCFSKWFDMWYYVLAIYFNVPTQYYINN